MPNQDQTLTAPQGTFILHRLPHRPRELLRAWDAADEYVLDTLADTPPNTRVLIVNDTFGALAVALHQLQPFALSDSYLSQQATRINLLNNNLPEHAVKLTASLDALDGMFNRVVIKVPKTLALLEDQLIRLRPHINADTQIIVAGMVKALPANVWKLLERLIGATSTSLAKKKARLIFATLDENLAIPANPYPIEYQLENTDYWLSNHANVFSRDRLDIGTRFFLEHLPMKPNATDIIDLACGNGVVGLIAAERNPNATLHFIDESFMAVASARTNFERAFGEQRTASFQVGDGLSDFAAQSADVILCNPPFHQQNTIGDQIAVQLFKQAKNVLKKGGELWVIGNRHLNYYQDLNRLFGHCTVVASNTKFVIWQAKA
ncbi:MAG: methyltransferase domain-containing protein [Methylococcales bacterium]|nr:methyltransferase domain-containing protein [Methylococcales bacterium]